MPLASPIRRFAALAVAAHLALLPVRAAAHEPSHWRFEGGVALQDRVAPSEQRGSAAHRVHLDQYQENPIDLVCAFGQLLQNSLGKVGALSPALGAPPAKSGAIIGAGEEFPAPSPALAHPQNRSPPCLPDRVTD
jgi:hypothetical protein